MLGFSQPYKFSGGQIDTSVRALDLRAKTDFRIQRSGRRLRKVESLKNNLAEQFGPRTENDESTEDIVNLRETETTILLGSLLYIHNEADSIATKLSRMYYAGYTFGGDDVKKMPSPEEAKVEIQQNIGQFALETYSLALMLPQLAIPKPSLLQRFLPAHDRHIASS